MAEDRELLLDPSNQKAFYEEFLNYDGGDVVLRVDRGEEEYAKRPEHFPSEHAFENLLNQAAAWIGSRMVRRHKARGVGVKNLEVTVSVRMDGEDPETTETVRFTAIDGRHRRAS
jgi:hypothetical protein